MVDGPVTDMTVTPLGLVVAGSFLHAGGLRVPGIAVHNGVGWRAVWGLDTASVVTCHAFAEGALWLGGTLPGLGALARWDGRTLAAGSAVRIDALGEQGGRLIAAGRFTVDGLEQEGVALRAGDAWRMLAAPGLAVRGVRRFTASTDALYALGELSLDGVPLGPGVARWDGLTWSSLGADVDGPGEAIIRDIRAWHGDLWMAGRFSSVGGIASYGVARWSPGATAGTEGGVHARLEAPAPDPFTTSMVLSFTLPHAGGTRITVHDLAGRRMRTLVAGALSPGAHHLEWDGRDAEGRALPPGVYLARLQLAGEPAQVRRVVRLR